MDFLKGLLSGGKKRDVRETTDEEANAILVPLGGKVADFKDRTKISYTHLLPAINSVGVKLLIQARGLESTQRLYRAIINDFDSKGGIATGSFLGMSKPPVAPETIAELNGMLWNIANDQIARGRPAEHVGQAYTGLAMMVAERAGEGDTWLIKYLLAEAARELKIDFKELNAAKTEKRVQCPEDTEEPVRTLFNNFRDMTYLFKERSGLDWEHLIPGIQAAATVHLIKDRGKTRTIEFLEQQISGMDRAMQNEAPKEFPSTPITALHITNMAKFNELILEMADGIVRDTECPPRFVAHALSLLVMVITTTYFDLYRTMAAFAVSCDGIREGRYDQYQQMT